jgi:2-polyprenyl-6-methoxyphenol hydroxylase-like FAD-dependent oxidoreductase
MQDDNVFDVIQIGYGPVGQTTAALLGRDGLDVAAFERWPELYGRARAGHVDHEVMRIFQSLGAAGDVEAHAHLAEHYTFRNGKGETLVEFDYNAENPSGWRSDYIVYQPDVETALNRAVEQCPTVQVHQGWEATAVEQGPDSVSVTVQRVDRDASGRRTLGAESRVVRGRYLVAADGANSFVRAATGIGWTDLGFRSTWLVVDLVPTGPMSFGFDNGQVCDPARPHCLFQLGKSHRRFEFAALPGEDARTLDDPEFAWRLMAQYGVTPDNAVIERRAVYTFGSSVAEHWRSRRAFLAGDAAHLMPPFMGQGMCTGIRDAANLAWRLNAVLTGQAGEELLDSYETERAPHAHAVVRMSMAAGELSCTFDPVVAEARDHAYRTGAMPPPPPFPVLEQGLLAGAADPLAGHLAPQGRVRVNGQVGRFDDVVGRGWVLLSLAPVTQHLAPAALRLLANLNAHVAVVDDVSDIDGYYRGWFDTNGVAAILYRPDFHVFGSAADARQVPALIERLVDVFPAPVEELTSQTKES